MNNSGLKTAALAGLAGAWALVALTGCAGNSAVSAEPTTTTTPTSSAVSAAPATEASSASSSSPAPEDRAGAATAGSTLRSAECAAAALHGALSVTSGGGAAGHQGYELVFRNTGSTPCTLQGWPGVSFVGKGDGTQIGAPATPDRSSAHGTVTIAAGSIAHATVLVADARDYDDCEPTSADGFRVYPPGSEKSLFVDAGQLQLLACSAADVQQLEVQAIQPGS